jgi:hypothetical protein
VSTRPPCASPARLRPFSRYDAASFTRSRRRIFQLAWPEVKDEHAAVDAFRVRHRAQVG